VEWPKPPPPPPPPPQKKGEVSPSSPFFFRSHSFFFPFPFPLSIVSAHVIPFLSFLPYLSARDSKTTLFFFHLPAHSKPNFQQPHTNHTKYFFSPPFKTKKKKPTPTTQNRLPKKKKPHHKQKTKTNPHNNSSKTQKKTYKHAHKNKKKKQKQKKKKKKKRCLGFFLLFGWGGGGGGGLLFKQHTNNKTTPVLAGGLFFFFFLWGGGGRRLFHPFPFLLSSFPFLPRGSCESYTECSSSFSSPFPPSFFAIITPEEAFSLSFSFFNPLLYPICLGIRFSLFSPSPQREKRTKSPFFSISHPSFFFFSLLWRT